MDWAWKHLKCARSQEFRRRDLTTSARILFDNSMHERLSYLASPNAGQITNYLSQNSGEVTFSWESFWARKQHAAECNPAVIVPIPELKLASRSTYP